MKKIYSLFATLLLALSLVAAGDAEAKRLGGGISRGLQRDSVTQQRQASPTPSGATQPQAAPQAAPQPVPGAAPQAPKRSWLGPLAGLAAGIGLAALLSHFGLGEGVASFLMILLLVGAAFFVIRLLLGRRRPQAEVSSLQYAGHGAGAGNFPQASGLPAEPFAKAVPGSAPAAAAVPPGFDSEGFLRVAKVNFLRMQAAHDAGNLDDLREFTTPEMFAELRLDIDDRKGIPQETDVIGVEARLIEVVTEGNRNIASVRFCGTVREERGGAALPFDEVWNLVKPADGSRGWAVAGIQQMN